MSVNPFEAPSAMSHHPARELGLAEILFSFEGRIPRSVYWGYTLGVLLLFYSILMALSLAFGEGSPIVLIVTLLMYVPLLWSSLAITVKRWHDRDYSGWMILIGLIPIVGSIWSFVELGFLRGTPGPNTYGADPT